MIRMMGVTTVALPDWSQFEADTGLKMEFTPSMTTSGTSTTRWKANDAGDRHDIFAQLTGVHRVALRRRLHHADRRRPDGSVVGSLQGCIREPSAPRHHRAVGRAAGVQRRYLRLLSGGAERAETAPKRCPTISCSTTRKRSGVSDSTTASSLSPGRAAT